MNKFDTKYDFIKHVFKDIQNGPVLYLDNEDPNIINNDGKHFYSIFALDRVYDMEIEIHIGEVHTTQDDADRFNSLKKEQQWQFIKDNLI